jgi:hypothetical protein
MEDYYGSHVDNNGHFVPQQYIPEDLTQYQNNVYGHYSTAQDIIEFSNIKAFPLMYFHSYHLDRYMSLENSNKIILPHSILSEVSKYNGIIYPLTFQIDGLDDLLGVADFSIDIDVAYLPQRIFDKIASLFHLDSLDGPIDIPLKLFNRKIARGTCVKFQVHDAKFIEIDDYKSYLETHLQELYSILQKNITIEIPSHLDLNYPDGRTLQINVVSCEPEDSIIITDTDLVIEFEEPVNYSKYIKEKQSLIPQVNSIDWDKREKEHLAQFGHLPVPYVKTKNGICFRLKFN